MDVGTLIMGAVIVAACLLPFVLIGSARSKRKKRALQSLTSVAKQHNCQIGQYEFCANFAIGIDEAKNFVFFFKRTQDEVIEKYSDLSEIHNSRVVTTQSTTGDKNQNYGTIDRIELILEPTAKQNGAVKLPFFEDRDNLQLSSELSLAEKWSKLINGRIKG